MFKDGLKCDNESTTKYIKVAIAPGGQLYIYLVGNNTVLVASNLAQENKFLQWTNLGNRNNEQRNNAVKNYQQKMPIPTQQEIADKRINTTIWKDINIQYIWKYTFEVIDYNRTFSMKNKELGVNYINGENAWCITPNYIITGSPKAIPLEIDGSFETEAGGKYNIYAYLGNVNGIEPKKQTYEVRRAREQELVKLFKDFYQKIGHKEFDVHLRISDDFKTGKVYLKKDKIEQEIPNVEVQIFDKTFGG